MVVELNEVDGMQPGSDGVTFGDDVTLGGIDGSVDFPGQHRQGSPCLIFTGGLHARVQGGSGGYSQGLDGFDLSRFTIYAM